MSENFSQIIIVPLDKYFDSGGGVLKFQSKYYSTMCTKIHRGVVRGMLEVLKSTIVYDDVQYYSTRPPPDPFLKMQLKVI